jgi:hypothetical protein
MGVAAPSHEGLKKEGRFMDFSKLRAAFEVLRKFFAKGRRTLEKIWTGAGKEIIRRRV